jgi:hypothetical protein
MAKVEIIDLLKKEILKKFKGESVTIFKFLKSLEQNPKKGKFLGQFAGFVLKELKYKSFRFYFIVDGNKLNVLSEEELISLLIRFVRMSDKKAQQKTINEIREILVKIGFQGFD